MNISVSKFKGMAPKIEPRLLAPEYAQIGTNIRYASGSLVPISAFEDIVTIPSSTTVKTIFKYKFSNSVDKWLLFEDNVTVCKDPIYSYLDNRIVITGFDVPRIMDAALIPADNTVIQSSTIKLGLPVPAIATIATASSGVGAFESRAYTIQYDRVWSTDSKIDQGPISAPAETAGGAYYVDTTTDGVVTVSNIADAPAGHGITHITINRSTSTQNDVAYHFVFTFNIADAKAGLVSGVTWNAGTSKFAFSDTIDTVDLGVLVTNQDYVSPPDDLQGIISVSGGMLAGFSGNSVYFCEPYQCHAWPEQYRVSVDKPIVGLGTFGEIVIVCTEAEPYIISIEDPTNARAFPIKEFAPCISADGIVSYRDAVVYPSYAGFIRVDRLGVANLTQNIADIRDMKQFNLTNVKAAGLGYYYYVLYTTNNNQRKLLMFNMQDPDMGFGMCDSNITCMFADFEAAILYAAHTETSGEQRIGGFDTSAASLVFSWKSKIFSTSEDTINLSAARVRFDAASLGKGQASFTNSEINNAIAHRPINVYPINGLRSTASDKDYINFNLYVDGNLVFTRKLYDTKPFRLPAGFIGNDYEIELTGAVPVYNVDVATSMRELAGN